MALIVVNYVAWLLNFGDVFRTFLLILMVGALAVAVLGCVRTKDFLALCILSFLLFLIVRSPLLAWDARSIWFFHAKRMFYDGWLYARLDDYGHFSHNDYPDMVPSLAASITRAVNVWNEVLPKLAIFLAIVPALMTLLRLLRTEVSRFLLGVILIGPILIGPRHAILVNGLMDGILGVYMAALMLSSCRLLAHGPEYAKLSLAERLTCPLLLAILCGLKNEGLVIGLFYLVTFTTVLFLNRYPHLVIARFVAASTAAFVPVMIWKIRLVSAHISNDLVEQGGGALTRVMPRLNVHDLESIIVATQLLPIATLMMVVGFWARAKLATKWFLLSMVGMYYLILFGLYLSTPLDLGFHLGTSAHRVIYPLMLTLVVFCIWSWEAEYLRKKALGDASV